MKVLVADDSLMMRRLLGSHLAGWGYDVVSVEDGAAAWDVLSSEEAPPIAILDWMMPKQTGVELCRLVRALKREQYTYLLLLTSRGLREDIVEGLSAGADDYIIKPFDKHELEVRLRAGRRIIDLQQELFRTQEALRIQATRDSLTGAWNRAQILMILEREMVRSEREGRPLGLLLMDLDHFKQVNDTYGHQVGDQVLEEVTERVMRVMRVYDSFGRYGGEEFIGVVPGCDAAGLCSQAERLRQALGDEPYHVGGHRLQLTASFGLTTFEPGTPSSMDLLVRAADCALYEAKRNGRNRAIHFPAPVAAVGR